MVSNYKPKNKYVKRARPEITEEVFFEILDGFLAGTTARSLSEVLSISRQTIGKYYHALFARLYQLSMECDVGMVLQPNFDKHVLARPWLRTQEDREAWMEEERAWLIANTVSMVRVTQSAYEQVYKSIYLEERRITPELHRQRYLLFKNMRTGQPNAIAAETEILGVYAWLRQPLEVVARGGWRSHYERVRRGYLDNLVQEAVQSFIIWQFFDEMRHFNQLREGHTRVDQHHFIRFIEIINWNIRWRSTPFDPVAVLLQELEKEPLDLSVTSFDPTTADLQPRSVWVAQETIF